jgi:hypothetical protein
MSQNKPMKSLQFSNPKIDIDNLGRKYIKDGDINANEILDTYRKSGQIIITAHLEKSDIKGLGYSVGVGKEKIQPKLVLDRMFLNSDDSIKLNDNNQAFVISPNGLSESNDDSSIHINVLGPLKSLLSISEVKQGSEGVITPAGGVPIAPSDSSVIDKDIFGILSDVEFKTKELLDMQIDDNSGYNTFKNILQTMQTNKSTILGKNDSGYKNDVENLYTNIDIYLSKTYNNLQEVQNDCQLFLSELQTIKSQVTPMVGGGTRRRKYKKRTTLRNKRRSYRYKK